MAHKGDTKTDNEFRKLPVASDLYQQMMAKFGGEVTMLEVNPANKLFQAINHYVVAHGNKSSDGHSHSWRVDNTFVQRRDPLAADEDGDDARSPEKESVKLCLGLGEHEIVFEGRLIRIAHMSLGDPVGGSCGPGLYTLLVLFVDGLHQESVLAAFCERVLAWDSQKDDEKYNIYMWMARHKYWSKEATKRVRPIESVILPDEIKDMVVDDLTDFDSRETARWYAQHGVPYKRSLLFSGPPGAGKSSFITALAGHLKRNVCFLQASHPEITDDNLQTCVHSAPARSFIVLEDIDALFGENRESKGKGGSPLTFSGLLNALDGVCNPEGQVFILTTNHIERLDPALIRPGRVDLRVHFTPATRQQVGQLFCHFYPNDRKLAQQFVDVIANRFVEKESAAETSVLGVSMAALQQLFIICRRKSALEAIEQARTFIF